MEKQEIFAFFAEILFVITYVIFIIMSERKDKKARIFKNLNLAALVVIIAMNLWLFLIRPDRGSFLLLFINAVNVVLYLTPVIFDWLKRQSKEAQKKYKIEAIEVEEA